MTLATEGAGNQTVAAYNAEGWMLTKQVNAAVATGGAPAVAEADQYDGDGRRTSVVEQLTSVTGGGKQQTDYHYDAAGRQPSVTLAATTSLSPSL